VSGGSLVIAHRGASGYEVENSLAAFRAAKPRGADAVELDVHATADGGMVVYHDDALPGRRPIARLALRDVRSHRLKNGEPIPTLEEALHALDVSLQVFVEVKTLSADQDDRLAAVLASGPNPAGYAVHSFDHRIIRRLAERHPRFPRGVLSASYALRPLVALRDASASTLWQECSLVDAELVRLVHNDNARVIVWTVNREDEMQRFVAMGVDGICTNFPDLGRRVVDERAA
jgi:glycerophosphoryl diester phosphodiesterase